MSSNNVTSAGVTNAPPSHHSGPGYVTPRNTLNFQLYDQLREVGERWLNFVPPEHRQDAPETEKSALETLGEHVSSCREHPFRALWVAHRHLQDSSPLIRVAALTLASEALWWLEHFQDAQVAAEAALKADPDSAQARWRLAVTLYRRGQFDQALNELDILLRSESRFAPAWALHGQIRVWLAAEEPEAARTDFETAAKLEPAKWVVPQRMETSAFRAAASAEIARFDSETESFGFDPNLVMELLPFESVAAGADPDARWHLSGGLNIPSDLPLAGLGGDFAAERQALIPPGTNFTLYQRNIENICGDLETLNDEIRKSVAELYKAALQASRAIAYKGAPEYHAEAEDAPVKEDA